LRVPEHPLIERVVVSSGFDAADDWIAERGGPARWWSPPTSCSPTAASRPARRVIAPNGKPFTQARSAPRSRRARSWPICAPAWATAIGGPAPFAKADRSRFLQALDEAQTTPNASIASATFLKPAMLAPFT
jgi:uncharacterized protein YaiI (UPF0178 family)